MFGAEPPESFEIIRPELFPLVNFFASLHTIMPFSPRMTGNMASGVNPTSGFLSVSKYLSIPFHSTSSSRPIISLISLPGLNPMSFNTFIAYRAATMGPLSSMAPLPYSLPFKTVGLKAPLSQPAPAGTTSKCPIMQAISSPLPNSTCPPYSSTFFTAKPMFSAVFKKCIKASCTLIPNGYSPAS